MYMIFKKIILHNFLSYGHAEIDLLDKHFCAVTGVNNNPSDNSSSNGVGKSAWSSAICWALTGQTIQGVSSNVKNIFIDEDLCYVTLFMKIDKDEYEITRYKNPKADLSIKLNDNDISGKGIRESEAVLAKYLPDLTSQLIASIIILGQKLPYKFTSNTPSGRKDVLEKLSKSDFMIQDLKNRIAERSSVLANNNRAVEDKILGATSKKSVLESQLKDKKLYLEELKKPQNFDDDIAKYMSDIKDLSEKITEHKNYIARSTDDQIAESSKLSNISLSRSKELDEENKMFNEYSQEFFKRKASLSSEIKNLTETITRLKNITDVCPTCGQKLPNVTKPSTVNEEKELSKLNDDLKSLDENYSKNSSIHSSQLKAINENYDSDISSINLNLRKIKENINIHSVAERELSSKLNEAQIKLNTVKLAKDSYTKNISNTEKEIYDLNLAVENLNNEILYNNNEKKTITDHITVVNQMNTLIKRDFRGYLISDIIDFIQKKVKEYSMEIFKNDNLEFKLDGNNINISYCGKNFENLSGGEQQRVDLIIQFAIRDMMKKNLGFSSNILILDEIFDNLDVVGCNSVLNLISNKINDVESIFIISHRAGELQIPYDSELRIVKSEKGVSEVLWE